MVRDTFPNGRSTKHLHRIPPVKRRYRNVASKARQAPFSGSGNISICAGRLERRGGPHRSREKTVRHCWPLRSAFGTFSFDSLLRIIRHEPPCDVRTELTTAFQLLPNTTTPFAFVDRAHFGTEGFPSINQSVKKTAFMNCQLHKTPMVSKLFSPLLHALFVGGQFRLACFCPSVESYAKFFCFESWHCSSLIPGN